MSSVTVIVPATTANIGPGFDCLGAALSLHNTFTFTPLKEANTAVQFTVRGLEAEKVSLEEDNLIYQAFVKVYRKLNFNPPPVAIDISLEIPQSRGLGSSATAIVAGLLGANRLLGDRLNTIAIRDLAIEIEGHPDNVVPALSGKCQLSVSNPPDWIVAPISWHKDIVPVVAIPDFELSTKKARGVLPKEYNRQDAIFNASHLGLLIKGLEAGKPEWLRIALEDRIHQPYRKSLLKGYDGVKTAALKAGAYGVVISGSGPTLLALAGLDRCFAVRDAMEEAWSLVDVNARVLILEPDTAGARVL